MRRPTRPVEIVVGMERSGACLVNRAVAETGRTWGSMDAAMARLKVRKNIGGQPSGPKVVSGLAAPWEEQAQRRGIWSANGVVYRGTGSAVAEAEAGCLCCCCPGPCPCAGCGAETEKICRCLDLQAQAASSEDLPDTSAHASEVAQRFCRPWAYQQTSAGRCPSPRVRNPLGPLCDVGGYDRLLSLGSLVQTVPRCLSQYE